MFWDLIHFLNSYFFYFLCRYYDKGKIEEEILEQRKLTNNNWNETKRSLRDARLSLKPQPLGEFPTSGYISVMEREDSSPEN